MVRPLLTEIHRLLDSIARRFSYFFLVFVLPSPPPSPRLKQKSQLDIFLRLLYISSANLY